MGTCTKIFATTATLAMLIGCQPGPETSALLDGPATDTALPYVVKTVSHNGGDAYVALMPEQVTVDGVAMRRLHAVALNGCANWNAALRAIDGGVQAAYESMERSDLVSEFGLDQHPALACAGGAQGIPLDAKVYADDENNRLLLPYRAAGATRDAYYAIKGACNALKGAVDLPSRLAHITRDLPAGLSDAPILPLSCGAGYAERSAGAGWRIWRVSQLFYRTQNAAGAWVNVRAPALMAILSTADDATYKLPILAIDGVRVEDVLAAEDGGEAVVARLAQELGAHDSRAEELAELPNTEVAALRDVVWHDVCLAAHCDAQRIHFRITTVGATSYALAPVAVKAEELRATRDWDGERTVRWAPAGLPGMTVAACAAPRLDVMLGFADAPAPAPTPGSLNDAWIADRDLAAASGSATAGVIPCHVAAAHVCERSIADGEALTAAHFAAADDCADKRVLRIRFIGASATLSEPIAIDGSTAQWSHVELIGSGTAVNIAPRCASVEACASTAGLPALELNNLPAVKLSNLTLRNAAQGDRPAQRIGILARETRLILNAVSFTSAPHVDAEHPAAAPFKRALQVEYAVLIARELQADAHDYAVYALRSSVAIAGGAKRSALRVVPVATTSTARPSALSVLDGSVRLFNTDFSLNDADRINSAIGTRGNVKVKATSVNFRAATTSDKRASALSLFGDGATEAVFDGFRASDLKVVLRVYTDQSGGAAPGKLSLRTGVVERTTALRAGGAAAQLDVAPDVFY